MDEANLNRGGAFGALLNGASKFASAVNNVEGDTESGSGDEVDLEEASQVEQVLSANMECTRHGFLKACGVFGISLGAGSLVPGCAHPRLEVPHTFDEREKVLFNEKVQEIYNLLLEKGLNPVVECYDERHEAGPKVGPKVGPKAGHAIDHVVTDKMGRPIGNEIEIDYLSTKVTIAVVGVDVSNAENFHYYVLVGEVENINGLSLNDSGLILNLSVTGGDIEDFEVLLPRVFEEILCHHLEKHVVIVPQDQYDNRSGSEFILYPRDSKGGIGFFYKRAGDSRTGGVSGSIDMDPENLKPYFTPSYEGPRYRLKSEDPISLLEEICRIEDSRK